MMRTSTASGLLQRAKRVLRQGLFLDLNRNVSDTVIVAGTARSGTTWLAQLLHRAWKSRLVFEPLRPDKVDEYNGFNLFQYVPPDDTNDRLSNYLETLFRGEIRNPWIDRYVSRFFPRGRLVKVVRGTLMLRWIHDRFPTVPIILLIRHPCAVTASRMELAWATDEDLRPMLEQPHLVQDFLSGHTDFIARLEKPEEKHAAIWCIHNLVPLCQAAPDWAHVVFYEDLCLGAKQTVLRIADNIGRPILASGLPYDKPSVKATSSSAVVKGEDPITAWQKKLSPEQAENVLAVVHRFGLEGLYGSALTPRPDSLYKYSNTAVVRRRL